MVLTARTGHKQTSMENEVDEVDTECAICGQVLFAPVTTTCRHTFCRSCLSVRSLSCLAASDEESKLALTLSRNCL